MKLLKFDFYAPAHHITPAFNSTKLKLITNVPHSIK